MKGAADTDSQTHSPATQSQTQGHASFSTVSMKAASPVSLSFVVCIFCINLYQNIMTLEKDKETGVQYYKVDANYIPADWSNDPEEFEGFPYTDDLAGYKFPSEK
ncbi:MAG: hypothetical protein Q9187_009624, partial [Circinaria calcarea]